jgi:hypothetical protein
MAYNMYNQVGKVRMSLKAKGFEVDVPVDVFFKELMILFGMRKRKAVEWTSIFCDVGLVCVESNVLNFKD